MVAPRAERNGHWAQKGVSETGAGVKKRSRMKTRRGRAGNHREAPPIVSRVSGRVAGLRDPKKNAKTPTQVYK